MWTKILQLQTKEYFELEPSRAGLMKQFGTDKFGIGRRWDDGECVIFDLKTEEKYVFETINDLLKAGWAID